MSQSDLSSCRVFSKFETMLMPHSDPNTLKTSSWAFRGLRGWRFARLAVCAVGGLRGWQFARLAVCAVGGLRSWRFARLAVCAVGGLRGWRLARLAFCAVGVLRGWRFARWHFARLAFCAVGGWRFAVGVLRLELSSCSFNDWHFLVFRHTK